MASKRWIPPAPCPEGCPELAAALGVSRHLAALLLARGAGSEADGRRYLAPSLEHLHDPFLLPDARPAVERLARAISGGEKILVHGDYDVDGVCGVALLTRVLKVLKANVEPFVPHRREHGYDLRPDTVRRAAAEGVRLIVTVDCGIVAFDSAEVARSLGVDLIVTDHHEPAANGELPHAVAVVNPKRADSAYPFPELCGTGVAFKLACALVQHLGVPSVAFRTAFLDLVALATCADCMPLVDENRVLVRFGLESLRATNKAGLKELMRISEVDPAAVNARSLGFALGPRINAIGRLDAARHALQLLLTGDGAEARDLAELLDRTNRERQLEQEKILQDALRQAQHFLDDRILVLAAPGWHPGVIGIVASKIAESLCRPTVMIAIDEDLTSARGSCRSVEGFHIFDALSACRHHLQRCGGHRAAAGFDIAAESIDALRAALQDYAAIELDEDLLTPSVRVDLEVPPEAVDMRLARELSLLEPFGHGNEEPVFVSRGLHVHEQRRMANRFVESADHMKLRLRCPTLPRGIDALFWRSWPRAEECLAQSRIDVCYTVEINTYNGNRSVQLNLRDLRACEA